MVTAPSQGSIHAKELQVIYSITWSRGGSLKGYVVVEMLLNSLSVKLIIAIPSRCEAAIAHNYFLT